jgi:hypothetical protein
MSCNIKDKTILEKAQDYVNCPNSMVSNVEIAAMMIAILLDMSNSLES